MGAIEILWQWLKKLIALILFASFLEMLIPKEAHRKLLRLVTGVLIMAVFLEPAEFILSMKEDSFNFLPDKKFNEKFADEFAALKKGEAKILHAHFAKRISKEITGFIWREENCRALVTATLEGKAENLQVSEITIELFDKLKKSTAAELKEKLSQEYGINRAAIKIND